MEKAYSSDYWYSRVVNNIMEKPDDFLEDNIVNSLKEEIPNTVSTVMDRLCNLQCRHCLFQKEAMSSEDLSEKYNLLGVLENIIKQAPDEKTPPHYERPMFIHEGRSLRKWHLDAFEMIRKERPDMKIGLIDNGSYLFHLDEFKKRNLKLDWLDISVDGTEMSHNAQRDPVNRKAYRMAMEGLENAREVTLSPKEGGRVTALYTLTKLNYRDVEEAGNLLLSPNSKSNDHNYIDEFYISSMTPQLEENFEIEISPEDFKVTWEQVLRLNEKYNKSDQEKVFVKLYYHKDIERLAYAVGHKKFWESMSNTEGERSVGLAIGEVIFYIDDVSIRYFPYSIWPQETINIDVDATYRVATSQKYRIEELRSGVSSKNENIKAYTNEQLTTETSYVEAYKRGVDNWWSNFGKKYLEEEAGIMRSIKNRSAS